MSDLIQMVVSIKDPFTLCAFVAVLLLVAFRTKTVPEALFKLLSEKITRQRFYKLLNRALLYAFAVFLVLCGLAVVGQVLSYRTAVRAASVEELKAEVALRQVDAEAAQRAVQEYETALALATQNDIAGAIASLEASVKAVPTASARETLALLHQQAGNTRRATEVAQQAVAAARATGDAMRIAKAERVLHRIETPVEPVRAARCPPDASMVGAKIDLPPGGDTFETAPLLVPCVYRGTMDTGREPWKYYKLHVQKGQTLSAIFRVRDSELPSLEVFRGRLHLRLHGPNGARAGEIEENAPSGAQKLEYKAEESGFTFIGLNYAVRDSVFQFVVQ